MDTKAKLHIVHVAHKLYTIPHAIDDLWVLAA